MTTRTVYDTLPGRFHYFRLDYQGGNSTSLPCCRRGFPCPNHVEAIGREALLIADILVPPTQMNPLSIHLIERDKVIA